MPETKSVSPLPEGFCIGKPLGAHDGIRCYPAVKEDSNEKYVVKIISVPASQVQLEALLLTGAYKDAASAMEYFRDVAQSIARETELLNTLSRLDGFLPFESCQVIPMENGKLGYQVCLLSPYRRSLAKFMKKNPVTHLQAVNLGLDLCTALAICRRAGYLYVDLKPANVFITKGKGYRIGDLGLVELDSLKYASLPGKYRSAYSPPEAHNDLNTLNETVDTYAVGMILYQIYNEGALPNVSGSAEPIPSPANADYEIGEIILKAIAPDPADRWKNPIEMGKALVAYMQRNTVNNVPIAPPSGVIPTDSTPLLQDVPVETPIQDDHDADASVTDADSEPEAISPSAQTVTPEGIPAENEISVPEEAEITAYHEEVVEQAEEAEQMPDPSPAVEDDSAEEPSPVPEPVPEQIPVSQQTMKVRIPQKRPAKAKPAPVDLDRTIVFNPVPSDTVVPTPADDDDDFDFNLDEFIAELDLNAEPEVTTPEDRPEVPPVKRRRNEEKPERKSRAGVILAVLLAVFLLVSGCCAFIFYQNFYLISVDGLTVNGSKNEMVVSIDSTGDHTLLKVSCTDTYGSTIVKDVHNGQAVFTDLLPGSLYRIELQVDGFHKLTGKTSEIFTTDNVTNIVDISAIAGSEDGSVVLNFTVDGAEPEEWTVTCSAEGEKDVVKSFTGHSVTVRGLATGKLYNITLSGGSHMELTGSYSISHIPSRLILAQDLMIAGIENGNMTVRWKTPENAVVESWSVRCYNNNGYEEIREVTGNEVVFNNLDTSESYTVEVTAAGMTEPERTGISANPINVTGLNVDEGNLSSLSVSWKYEGSAPEGGWLLLYSVDGQDNQQSVVKCDSSTAVLSPRIPGASYKFTIQAADSTTIFNNIHTYSCPSSPIFSKHGLSADRITAVMLKTPSDPDWKFEGVDPTAFTDTFVIGDKISVVLKADANYFIPEDALSVLYVIRDENGKVVLDCISEATEDWKELWYAGNYRCGELNIPKAPSHAGKYSLSIFFNGYTITTANFAVQE